MAWYESILGENPLGQLALPAARVRRALTGQNPFVDYRDLLSGQEASPSGREVLETWGLASPDSGMGMDALGWLLEEGTNPLNYVPMFKGAGLLKNFAGNVAIGAGVSAAGGAFSPPTQQQSRPPRFDPYDELEMMLDQMLLQPQSFDDGSDFGY